MPSDPPHESEPDTEVIAAALQEVGRKVVASDLRLVPLERASNRIEASSRRSFRVETDQAILCVLHVGKDLRDLRDRSTAFSAACPTISCPPLFWKTSESQHYLATEHFAGDTLESLVAQGKTSAAGAVEVGEQMVTALNQTFRPSTQNALRAELNLLLQSICRSALFTDLDRSVLENIVFPFIRDGAASARPRVRWTNGDFVARNVLVSDSRECRLIDYEFAAETHFFGEDAWRWHLYSELPEAARKLPSVYPAVEESPWLEALAIVRQLALAYRVNGLGAAMADAPRGIARLTQLLGARRFGLGAAVFLQPTPQRRKPNAQLFWSSNDVFTESNSQIVEYEPGQDVMLRFCIPAGFPILQLRLDPANRPGPLSIRSARLQRSPPEPALFHLDEATGWAGIQSTENAVVFAGSGSFHLFGRNDDPQIRLAEQDVGPGRHPLTLEVTLRFHQNLSEFPDFWTQNPDPPAPL